MKLQKAYLILWGVLGLYGQSSAIRCFNNTLEKQEPIQMTSNDTQSNMCFSYQIRYIPPGQPEDKYEIKTVFGTANETQFLAQNDVEFNSTYACSSDFCNNPTANISRGNLWKKPALKCFMNYPPNMNPIPWTFTMTKPSDYVCLRVRYNCQGDFPNKATICSSPRPERYYYIRSDRFRDMKVALTDEAFKKSYYEIYSCQGTFVKNHSELTTQCSVNNV